MFRRRILSRLSLSISDWLTRTCVDITADLSIAIAEEFVDFISLTTNHSITSSQIFQNIG